MTKKNSIQLSLQRSETVRGYEIRRLPLGEYLTMIELLRTLPEKLFKACFPQDALGDALHALKTADAAALMALLSRAMQVMPLETVRLISVFTGVDQAALLNDPDIGLDGAAEMLEAFWRLNGMENFIHAAGQMAAQAKALRTGFSG